MIILSNFKEKCVRIFKIFILISSGIIYAQEVDSLLYSKLYDKGEWKSFYQLNTKDEYKLIKRTYKVNVVRLNKFIISNLTDRMIDVIKIDVEGHELEVLKGMKLGLFKPKLITIEIHVNKTKDIFQSKVYKFLKKNKYELISQYRQTSFFIPIENLSTLN